MRNPKDLNQQIQDLSRHSKLLAEACDRFKNHNFDEVINIASRLRALVTEGKGNDLLLRLSKILNFPLNVYALKNFVELTIKEIDPDNCIVQEKRIRKLLTHSDPTQGTLPILTLNDQFKGWLGRVIN